MAAGKRGSSQVAQRLRSVDDQEDLVALGALAHLEPLRVARDDGAVGRDEEALEGGIKSGDV